jgi:hypothetical protein
LFGGRITPALRSTTTDAPVANPSLPPEPAESSRGAGPVAFTLLVAGIALVAGVALKKAHRDAPPATATTLVGPSVAAALPEAANPPAATPPSEPAAAAPPLPEAAPPAELPAAEPVQPQSPGPTSLGETKDAPAQVLPKSTAPARAPASAAPAPPPANIAFDAGATNAALAEAAARSSGCKKPNDPSGMAVVTITFAPSGRVTSANIAGPPFAGTETGSCIASLMRSVHVPLFTGDFITVKKTIHVE